MNLKHLVTPRKPRIALVLRGASAGALPKPPGVDHRDGGGHLDPIYEAELRGRARDRARRRGELAFVGSTHGTDARAKASGEQFVETVTSGEEGARDDETAEERGGPFVETSAETEFAFGTDESNPVGSTREPFPTS